MPLDEVVNVNAHDPSVFVLRKKESHAPGLRRMFGEYGTSLSRNLKLQSCSYTTDLDEDQFVRYYPYLPHLIELSSDIAAGIRQHGNANALSSASLTVVGQCFTMLKSRRTRLADADIGVLVSIDKIYDLLEGGLPVDKQDDVRVIAEACGSQRRYHGMAARVAKAICLMELVQPKLPRTPANIAALLIQHVAQEPPTRVVTDVLEDLRGRQFTREGKDGWTLHQLDEMQRAVANLEALRQAVGTVNPRPPGWRNNLIQLVKRALVRSLNWYTQPMVLFNSAVTSLLEQIYRNLADVSVEVVTLQTRLAESENRAANLQTQLHALQDQTSWSLDLEGNTKSRTAVPRSYPETEPATYRTAYIVGLFGTGRTYLCELVQQNGRERAGCFRDCIRFHPSQTRMIYSGHVTIKYVCHAQHPPAVARRILQAQRAELADLIFVCRHPLDSLLTNWVWWRQHIGDQSCISGVSQVYASTQDLCADLERNFAEFNAFAEGNPDFFRGIAPGSRFLSFTEFVEETDLYLGAGVTLAVRLEDCMIDPLKEFRKVTEVLRTGIDSEPLDIAPPRSKPYRYASVAEGVPEFRKFINGLSALTRRRIEKMGYPAAL